MDGCSVNKRDDGASVWVGSAENVPRREVAMYILGGSGDNGRNAGGVHLCAFSCVRTRPHGISTASVSVSTESGAPRAGSGVHSVHMCRGGGIL